MSTAPPAAIPAGEEVATPSSEAAAAQSSYPNLPGAEIIESLPLETRLQTPRRLYRGFWLAEFLLKAMAAGPTCFEPEPSDIFLASIPKSGTTWLKALAFATLNRATHSPSDGQHPFNHRNPHSCVGFLEFMTIQDDIGINMYDALPSSPRLFATHLPYSMLPPAITAEGSRCRIVYVCRDPKDVLISYWNFYKKAAAKAAAAAAADGDGHAHRDSASSHIMTKFEEAFELFCDGRFPYGPHWLHALEYWHASQRRPDQVLFLRYEDMLGDPVGHLKKLAEFMGCAFSEEDEEAGVVDQIVELCSLGSLKSMDVNKNGSTMLGVKNDSFFRKGQAGDWKNYMTMDMAARLDKIVEEATRGSGLTFGKTT